MKSKGYRIRLTEEEFNKLSKAAEQSGCTKAEYIRNKMQFSNTNPEMKTLAEIREEAYNKGRREVIEEIEKQIDKWKEQIGCENSSDDDENWYTSLKMLLEEKKED